MAEKKQTGYRDVPEHVHFPATRKMRCWLCSCGEVYQPTDVRQQLLKKEDSRWTRSAPIVSRGTQARPR